MTLTGGMPDRCANRRCRALHATVALAAALGAVPAAAQEQKVPTSDIIVTGTRIQGAAAAAANPITTVSEQDIARTEAVTVEQVLRKLPSIDFTGGFTANTATAGSGASNVGLRNLGPQRTLVLVNGYRYPFTDVAGSAYDAVDLGNVDVATIDRIEVLRDGASSVYGADAIGGVVNIITKQHFAGIEAGGGLGITSHGDGFRQNLYLLAGGAFGRLDIRASVSETQQNPILSDSRDWSQDQHPDAGYNAYANLSTRVNGALLKVGSKSYYFGLDGPAGGIVQSNAASLGAPIDSLGIAYGGGGFAPGDIAIPSRGGVYFNFLPTEGLTVAYRKWQGSLTLDYKVSSGVTATLEGFYTDRRSNELRQAAAIGSTPTQEFPLLYIAARLPDGTLNLDNPTNPDNPAYATVNPTRSAALTNVNVPILTRVQQPRLLSQVTDTYRLRAGLQGSLANGFAWQAGYYYAASTGTFDVTGQPNFRHYAQELGMVACNGAAGCSTGNFLGYGLLTPDQLAYLTFTSVETSAYRQQAAYANVTGPLLHLPAGPLAMALGTEYRLDSLTDTPSPIVSSGDASSFSLPTAGSYRTASAYLELDLPLLRNAPLVRALTVNLSGRYDHNTKFGGAWTYKAGVDLAVSGDFRIRASRSSGFRAPQLRELYGGASSGTAKGSDPCQRGGAFADSAQCLASLTLAGATTADVPVSGQLNTVAKGGNPDLRPETSRQWLAGGVLTPRAVPGLSLSVDYYAIEVRDEISSFDPNQLLSACYGGVAYLVSQAEACTLTSFNARTPGTGSLGVIYALNGNIGTERTQGLDAALAYRIDTPRLGLPSWGRIDFDASANYLIDDKIGAGATVIEQAGTFNGSSARPRWKALASVDFVAGDWSVDWTTRYYGGTRNQDGTSACRFGTVACTGDVYDFPGNEIGGVFYHDVQASYRHRGLFLAVGVDNLFDTSPPFVFPGSPGTTLGAAGYDFPGRFVYLKASLKL